MALVKLQFAPGLNKEDTGYSNEGRWVDGDMIRFRQSFPERIGGWVQRGSESFLGTCRSLHSWNALDGSNFIGIGTHLKFYIDEGGLLNDVTPLRETTLAGSVTFDATAGVLEGDIDDETQTIPLVSTSGWPTQGRIKIDSEEMTYASITDNSLTDVTRGVNDTTAASHLDDAAVNCATIIVTCAFHGAVTEDFVTLSGAATLGGQITADVLNQQYQVISVPDANTFYIEARSENTSLEDITTNGVLSPTFVYATSSDTGNGGASALGSFQINMGLDSAVIGTGWGSGPWSRDTWGSGTSLVLPATTMRQWSQDNFGEDLLACVRDGDIYYWDRTGGVSSRMVKLSEINGSDATAPTVAKQVMVSDNSRHVIVFGCDGETSIGTQDPLLIRFSHGESLIEWATTSTNTAGELRIGAGTEFVVAVETKKQTLVFTDTALYAMQYLGPPYTFGLDRISTAITIVSPGCAVAVDDIVFWMGLDDFYMFNGRTQKIPCSVQSYVFNNFNKEQGHKVTVALNTAFNEVWWFYPSSDSTENDLYVIYNYQEEVWSFGVMGRTAWMDRGIATHPIGASTDGHLYYHEHGLNDGSTTPAQPITAYVESGDLGLGAGDEFVFLDAILPDVAFGSSGTATPLVTLYLKVRNSAGGDFTKTSGAETVKTAAIPVEIFTDRVSLRLRGRSFRLRVESNDSDVFWRLGIPRVNVRPDGGR